MVRKFWQRIVVEYKFMRMMDAKDDYASALDYALTAQKKATEAKEEITAAKARFAQSQKDYASAVVRHKEG